MIEDLNLQKFLNKKTGELIIRSKKSSSSGKIIN